MMKLYLLAIGVLLISSLVWSNGSPAQTLLGQTSAAATDASQSDRLPVLRTDSPRDTLTSFVRLRDEVELSFERYLQEQTAAESSRLRLLLENLGSLFDLSSVPIAERRYLSVVTAYTLLDVFGRIDVPDLSEVPDETTFDGEATASWRIPETPLRLVRIEAGDRSGEFLFSAQTVAVAPRFLQGVRDLPLRSRLQIESWVDFVPQLTGPMIPHALVESLPAPLRSLWFDTPVWKTVAAAVLLGLGGALVLVLARITRNWRAAPNLGGFVSRILLPVSVFALALLVFPFVFLEIGPAGRMFSFIRGLGLLLQYAASAWLFWLATLGMFELIVRSTTQSHSGLDANLLRLVARIIGVVGVVIILAVCGHVLGLPVLSLLAGLGIGGLAVALAIRPTLENLIGGIILYIDKPVSVGDYCTFGSDSGTVERIGVRSTEIRAIDRTLISIPNAQFADMKLINWARCDRMLINNVIGLRYETTPDQLRLVLVRIREMLHAHPRIDPDTIRVRYVGPAASARDISIRIYALTREWNDFYAIQEDVFLRIDDIVDKAGSGYAFPSQTLYLGRDQSPDTALRERAESEVQDWRRKGRLPFPRIPEWRRAQLVSTLDYPPTGSYEAMGASATGGTVAEPLSAPEDPPPDEEEPTSDEKRAKPSE